jgi:hypothetical protein
MALLWLADRVDIWTLKRNGRMQADSVNWKAEIAAERFPVVSGEWKPASLTNTPEELLNVEHGTLIEVHLRPQRRITAQNVRRDLGRLYAPAERLGKRLMWTTVGRNGKSTELVSDPLELPDEEDKYVRLSFTAELPNGDLLPVEGVIGLVDGLPQSASTVAVGYGCRVIDRTRDCFSNYDGTARYSGVGITGWLDLGDGWQPYLATTKDAMDDEMAWYALMDLVFNRIRHLLEMAEEDKLSIELDDIAMMLEQALDGSVRAEVPRAGKRSASTTTANGPGPTPGEDKEEGPKPDPTDDPGDDSLEEEESRARLQIIQLSDAEMEGDLCRADVGRKLIEVFVNREHDVVKTALVSKPVNRMALNLMVVYAIAAQMADNRAIAELAFPVAIQKRLQMLTGRPAEGFLVRTMMDRIRTAS